MNNFVAEFWQFGIWFFSNFCFHIFWIVFSCDIKTVRANQKGVAFFTDFHRFYIFFKFGNAYIDSNRANRFIFYNGGGTRQHCYAADFIKVRSFPNNFAGICFCVLVPAERHIIIFGVAVIHRQFHFAVSVFVAVRTVIFNVISKCFEIVPKAAAVYQSVWKAVAVRHLKHYIRIVTFHCVDSQRQPCSFLGNLH